MQSFKEILDSKRNPLKALGDEQTLASGTCTIRNPEFLKFCDELERAHESEVEDAKASGADIHNADVPGVRGIGLTQITHALRQKLAEYAPIETEDTMIFTQVGSLGYETLMQLCDDIDSIHAQLEESWYEKARQPSITPPMLSNGEPLNAGDVIVTTYYEYPDGHEETSVCARTIDAIIWDGDRWDFRFDDGDTTEDINDLSDFYESTVKYEPDTFEKVIDDALESRMGEVCRNNKEHVRDVLVSRCYQILKEVTHGCQ